MSANWLCLDHLLHPRGGENPIQSTWPESWNRRFPRKAIRTISRRRKDGSWVTEKQQSILSKRSVLPLELASKPSLKALLPNDSCCSVTRGFVVIGRPLWRAGHFYPKHKNVEMISFLSFLGKTKPFTVCFHCCGLGNVSV